MAESRTDITGVVLQARALPEEEREAFLAAACPDSDTRREILALLRPSEAPDTSPLPSAVSHDGELPPGTRIGVYTILDTIGAGGMGRVYLAKDTSLHRHVAIKCLRSPGTSRDEERAAMLREARAAAQVSHAHVAAIYEFLVFQDHAFIVMEYVEGRSLAALLRHGRTDPRKVVSIGRQLAQAVAAAHEKGVVHRDLKPANIRLTPDGSAKILDFGVAGLTAAFTTVTAFLGFDRGPQLRAGTRGYMSPEQLWGRGFDERSDIFSLGIVLWEMATGRRAYPDIDDMSLIDAMSRPLARADTIEPAVPRALAEALARATAIEPAGRYPSATMLDEALAGIEPQLGPMPREKTVSDPPRVVRAAGRLLGAAVSSIAAFTALGYVNTRTFNWAVERVGFVQETPLTWFVEGLKSCVPMLFVLAVFLVIGAIAMMVRTILLPISKAVSTADATLRRGAMRISQRAGLRSPSVLASWLLLAFALATVSTWWAFATYLDAVLTPITRLTPEHLAVMAPESEQYRHTYQQIMTALVVLGTLVWSRLWRPLVSSGVAADRALLAGGIALVVVALVSLEVQYQFFLQRTQMPIVRLDGVSCFLLGERADSVRLYCPGQPEPIQTLDSPGGRLERTGRRANVFAPAPR